MSNWFNKIECTANTQKIKQFYNKVLIDFLDKIYKQNRYRTAGGLDQNKIAEFDNRIRNYLSRPEHLFQKCIEMKEGSSRLAQAIKNQITNDRYELKIQHEEDKDNYLPIPHKTRSQSKIEGKNEHHRQEEQYEDDLAEYEDAPADHHRHKHQEKKKVEVEIKKEENVIEYHVAKTELKIEEDNSDSDQSYENNLLTIRQCEKSLNSIVVGSFNANTIKHKPKEEKTFIELDNVFIKWPQGETFYGSLSMEATRMDKQSIQKEIPIKGRKIVRK